MSNTSNQTMRIAITLGEPGGIGPDITLALAFESWDAQLVVIGEPALLKARAKQLDVNVTIREYDPNIAAKPSPLGELCVSPVALKQVVVAGQPAPENAQAILDSLNTACDGCLNGEFSAMVTGPIQKSSINDAGINFTGHTEYLAKRTGGQLPVMMLSDISSALRVALVTTHLALRDVPNEITTDRLIETCRTVQRDLQTRFGITHPRIAVLGLNPHAGESGHMGREEIEIIQPAIEFLRADGLQLSDAMPADTAFTQHSLKNFDAVLAMYHDQGLPVIKHAGFGNIVNITLGLPIIRTSVDHGTALDLAGTGKADPQSLLAAVKTAVTMGRKQQESEILDA
ncbi:MAG: 4-hydroxythreonine-4-phosphate dehydrogenase PdxA [Gammaproteobacteria bacterium]|nr:4-hydroxythreonine-4-phosphate dehydrogenase PdxA [Gammaproteobacteria bacterium]